MFCSDQAWVSGRMGVNFEREAPSLHSHAGQVVIFLSPNSQPDPYSDPGPVILSLVTILVIFTLILILIFFLNNQAIRELTGRYFAQVSHRVKKRLAAIYKHDFLMFGYNPFI